jgi:hypothetical protein
VGRQAVRNMPGAAVVRVPDRGDDVSLVVAEEQGSLLRVSIRVQFGLSPAVERGGSAGKIEAAESAPGETLE